MKRLFLLVFFLLAAACCAAPAPQHNASLGDLDRLVPLARKKAAEIFHMKEADLWFSGMDCRYYEDWPEQDSTNALRWYTFTFFDPHSVQPSSNGTAGVTAMSYSISLTSSGQYKRSSYGRGIGWTENGPPNAAPTERPPRTVEAKPDFLADVPEFREFDLSMKESTLQHIITRNNLGVHVTPEGDHKTYRVWNQAGENVFIGFQNGKCTGIQRMSRDSALTEGAE